MGENFREFGLIVKIANIKPCEIFPLYGSEYSRSTEGQLVRRFDHGGLRQ